VIATRAALLEKFFAHHARAACQHDSHGRVPQRYFMLFV